MKISASDRQKKLFEKRYWRLTRKVLAKSRQQVTDNAEHIDPERLKDYVKGLLLIKPVVDHISDLWSKVGGSAMAQVSKQVAKVTGTEPKTAEAAEFLMRKYINERSLRTAVEKAGKILDAQTEAINKVIDTVIEKGKVDGLGILEVRKAMVKELESGTMTEVENWQAQRIALTEVGAAQNTGTWLEGKGQGLLKQWVHLPVSKVPRSNHVEYGQMEPQEEEFEYTMGLKYPHDENADAEEVINCYCDLYWVTKD
jgi:hypothetical protein